MITIINYGSGNISAIANVYKRINVPYQIADKPGDVEGAEKIILPGVGAFDETMSILDQSGFRAALDKEVLINKVPVMGICVGMQILARRSEEGILPGLGWINGEVKKIDKSLIVQRPKVPHLGWNSIKVLKNTSLFEGIDTETGFYFLHSYYFDCFEKEDVLTETMYGTNFASAVNHENIYGVQFHPEKSHQNGVNLLKNFAHLNA